MNRSPFIDRLGRHGKANSKQCIRYARLGFEQLEERRLLTTCNLLVSTFDPTAGSSVLEYSEATNLRLPGGVYSGDHGLTNATGLAVAAGWLLLCQQPRQRPGLMAWRGSGSALQQFRRLPQCAGSGQHVRADALRVPGTLAFGPDGNLYVADLGGGSRLSVRHQLELAAIRGCRTRYCFRRLQVPTVPANLFPPVYLCRRCDS